MLRAISPLLLLLACQPDGPPEVPPTVDCDAVQPEEYEELSIWSSCTECHASDLVEADRQGAPEGVDFDSYEAAVELAEDAAIEVYIGNMPFTGTVTEAEKEALYAWSMCGTP